MRLLKDYVTHLRFTVGEMRSNARRIGWGSALSFFLMRFFVPFGRPRRYFVKRLSGSPIVQVIDNLGFSELQRLDALTVDGILATLLKKASESLPEPVVSLDAYADAMKRAKVQRETGLISSGDPDCMLAVVARSNAFSGLASDYLNLNSRDVIVEATVDTLVPVGADHKPSGYDDALEFHRDIDAYKFLKIFVYLTDCHEGDGHHEIYLNSHRHYPLQLVPIRRYQAREIERFIPEAILKKVTGAAGYAFGENTLAFHRGTQPVRNYRVMFNLIYTESKFKVLYPNAFPLLHD